MLIPPSQRPEVFTPVTGRKGFRGGNACLFCICLFCPVQNLCILFLPEYLAKIANKIGRLGFLEIIKCSRQERGGTFLNSGLENSEGTLLNSKHILGI